MNQSQDATQIVVLASNPARASISEDAKELLHYVDTVGKPSERKRL